jgi:hypothetical protein
LLAVIAAVFCLINKKWANIAIMILGVLICLWCVRNMTSLVSQSCYAGICPTRGMGLFLSLLGGLGVVVGGFLGMKGSGTNEISNVDNAA